MGDQRDQHACGPANHAAYTFRSSPLGAEIRSGRCRAGAKIRSRGVGVGPTRDLAGRRICRGRRNERSGQCNTAERGYKGQNRCRLVTTMNLWACALEDHLVSLRANEPVGALLARAAPLRLADPSLATPHQ